MMTADTLVLNLTRFGDLLQSQALIQDLHDSGRTVGLVCLENFAPALPLLRCVDAAWPLPAARLMADMDADWRNAAGRLLDFVRRVRRQSRARWVINLTPTLPARLLTRLLAPPRAAVLGFGLDAEGFGVNGGVWSSFLRGATARRLNTPFNLVDMFRMVGAGACAPEITGRPGRFTLRQPSGQALSYAEGLLGGVVNTVPDMPGIAGFVGFQLGASEARRQWPAEYFAALGERLWREQALCPVLLGAPVETALYEQYARVAGSPFVNAVGKTDIPQLAALLGKCRMLVTNDTGTMHLAAGLGVPCLAIFLATAQAWDTSPYLADCCCLEPALACHPCDYSCPCPHEFKCLQTVSPQSVGDLVLSRLSGRGWEAGIRPDMRARAWVTNVDAWGFSGVRCLSGHETEDRSLWLGQQRLFWRQILDDLSDGRGMGKGAVSDEAPPYSAAFRDEVGSALSDAARLLDLLVEQGRMTGKIPKAGQLFLRTCDHVQQRLDACKPLSSLAHFWRELLQDRGDRMEELLRFTARLSAHLAAAAALRSNGRSNR
ncbi:MAG: glycosyltransferase family 9 protein [Desulfovibrio sp.]|jgi:ADP-heptose:LPS heptosyltransferase|nr:glycosyltransferase family 9 protein [Desulfovibrio sp.]